VLDRAATRGNLMDSLAAAVAAGVDRVQLRERGMEGAALLELADAVCRCARSAAVSAGRSVAIVVNRRADVALACEADGVHLGFDALPLRQARALLGTEALIGVSCHSAAEVALLTGDDTQLAEADYAHLAPIFPPLSKEATRPALGPQALGRPAAALPVLAQGGVDASNAAACLAAGAAGVAVTGAILMASDPGAAARQLRRALDDAAHLGDGATLGSSAGDGTGGGG